MRESSEFCAHGRFAYCEECDGPPARLMVYSQEHVDKLTAALAARDAEIAKLKIELKHRRSWMSRSPFCPDHRDKVSGKECRECEIESLKAALKGRLTCPICSGFPDLHASGKPCACDGSGLMRDSFDYLHKKSFDDEREIAKLEAALAAAQAALRVFTRKSGDGFVGHHDGTKYLKGEVFDQLRAAHAAREREGTKED